MDIMHDFFLLIKQELVITTIIFILLFIKVGTKEWANQDLLKIINSLLLINVVAGFLFNNSGMLFSNMFFTNPVISFEKNILNISTLIISLQAHDWLKQHKHVIEFYVLLLSTLLGMFFMISSGNLLMFYLGLELSTIPLAALANFDLQKRTSGEAAMKFIISSAFSSGLLLFGISMLYGATGTLVFTEIPNYLIATQLQLFAFILVLAGFAFKIAIVPFHLWTADVYQGSPVAVTAYLSVVSKGAVIFVFLTTLYKVFMPLVNTWYNMLFVLSVLTMLVGNLFAIRQTNIKRLMAFSSIAQVGFILIGLSGVSQGGATTVIYFILVYAFSNLAAFGVIAIVSTLTGKENINDYKALYSTNPFLACILTIALFSLAGIPPTAGFFGKFFLLMAGAVKGNYVWITVAAINMIVSLYYYLQVVKVMFVDEVEQPIEKLTINNYSKVALLICVAGIVVIGFASNSYAYLYTLCSALCN